VCQPARGGHVDGRTHALDRENRVRSTPCFPAMPFRDFRARSRPSALLRAEIDNPLGVFRAVDTYTPIGYLSTHAEGSEEILFEEVGPHRRRGARAGAHGRGRPLLH